MKKITLVASLFLSLSFAFGQEVSISPNVPASASPGQSFDAVFTLTKSPSMGSFAKFQIDLPAGFDAQAVESKGGNFTLENGRMKLVWVSLPGDASFDFSFKITAPSSAGGSKSFAPQFFYLENNVKKEYDMPAISVDFGGTSDNVAANENNTSGNENSTAQESNDNNDNSDNSSENNNTSVVSSNNSSSENTNTSLSNTTENSTAAPVKNTTAKTSGNVVYYIQVAALSNKPSSSRFAHYGSVKIMEENGLYKVLVGKYSSLEEARRHKPEMTAKGASGCFVVAFENGVKIKL